jgi:alpha-tubulin suppressor-like RCC1 family protein
LSFFSISENLTDIFVTESEIIDRYVGGTLWNWGYSCMGQLGNNSLIRRSSPVQTISGGTNWKQVSRTENVAGAIKTDGTLWLWGQANKGNLANNSTINRSSPVQTVSSGTNWRQLSVGGAISAAIKTDGTLWLWGYGKYGALGDNTTINRSSPVQTISSGTNWKQVAVNLVSAAIKTDGTLWLWGYGGQGTLGNGIAINRSSPVQTASLGTNWKQVSVGGGNAGAIKTDGTLWMWGSGSTGRLGNNCTINRSSPVQTVSSGNNWKQVSVGGSQTAAIKTDGTLWMWGTGSFGRLGDNSAINKSSPVQTVSSGTNWKQVGSGSFLTAAIKTDGTLWTWGYNGQGCLGDNSTITRSSPVQTVSSGTNWKQVCDSLAIEFC